MTITVLYNDGCPICSREVAAYRSEARRTGAPVAFEGLDRADLARWGLTPEAAARRLHVAEEGRVVGGLAAFIAVWRRLPRYGWLARLVDRRGVRPAAEWCYERIAAPTLYALHRRRVPRARGSS